MPEIILTDVNFDAEALQSTTPILVDFWAPWCGPCQMMGPIVTELANEFVTDKLKVGKLNVDDNQATAGKYEILSIPTFLIFKNGQVADRLIGGVPKEKMRQFIEKNIG